MIVINLDGIPPSSNNAYFNLPTGGRKLSTDGMKYKTETSTSITKLHQDKIRHLKKDHPYCALFVVRTLILNKGYKPDGKVARYKKLDATNRLKLLEDAIVTALGIDDSQFMISMIRKIHATTDSTTVVIWDAETESVIDVIRETGIEL